MCDMFLILNTTYFTGFADDNTPFVVRDNIAVVIKTLEEIGEKLVNWFSNNEMNLNTYKCQLLLNSQEPNALKIGNLDINNSLSEKQQKLNALKTCIIHGNNQKTYSYERVFQVTI